MTLTLVRDVYFLSQGQISWSRIQFLRWSRGVAFCGSRAGNRPVSHLLPWRPQTAPRECRSRSHSSEVRKKSLIFIRNANKMTHLHVCYCIKKSWYIIIFFLLKTGQNQNLKKAFGSICSKCLSYILIIRSWHVRRKP